MWKKIVFVMMMTVSVSNISFAQSDEDLYSFDVEAFTKKTWEWKGGVTLSAAAKDFNVDSVAYPIKFQGEEVTNSQESELLLTLESRWDWEWSRLFLSGDATVQRSSLSDGDDESALLREAYWQLATAEPHNLEIGKRLLRWGKGYAFNPVALMERPKDPEDPEASREGLWITQGTWISGKLGIFDNTSVNLVMLPVQEDVNTEYREDLEKDLLLGMKLYALIGTTDIDFYMTQWQDTPESSAGFDFASNLTPNFEVHGEYAVSQIDGSADDRALLGIRYLTDSEITWIVEAYHDASGLTATESRTGFESIGNLPPKQASPLVAELFSQKTLNKNYGYLKVSVKEPFGWLYFTPSLIWLGNLDDNSQNTTVQISYTPSDNWLLLGSWQNMTGDAFSQYGESLISDKLTVTGTYSF